MGTPFIHSDLYSYYEKSPVRLVDIGASGGIPKKWKSLLPFLEVIGFEPEKEAFDKLLQTNPEYVRYFNTGLYCQAGKVDLYVTRKQGCSSLLLPNHKFLKLFPNAARFEVIETSQVSVDTLDAQLSSNKVTDIDFIKIDTQGSELFILQGAEQTLESVFGLEVEVEFNEMYESQPLFGDVDKYLREHGYILFDLRRTFWKREHSDQLDFNQGQIISGDALYFRTVDSFLGKIEKLDEGAKRNKILKGLSLCLMYRKIDYANEIFQKSKTLFSSDEGKLIQECLQQHSSKSNPIPQFRGRQKLADWLLSGHRALKLKSKKRWWIKGDMDLGEL